jgi:agmatine/peptidylarginine deiminase
MKLTFFIFSISTFLFSQIDILPKDFSQNERLEMDSYLVEQFSKKSNTVFTDPPVFSVRTMAEWEEVQALTIAWEGYEPILTEIVRNAVEECNVIIACSNPTQVQNYLIGEGVNVSNVQCLNINTNSIWMRDYGQNTVYQNDVDSIYLVDWVYNRPRPEDDSFAEELSDYLNIDLYQTSEPPYELVATGGNFMSDGFGTAFSSELIIDENDGSGDYGINYPNHSEQEIDDIMYQFMGIQNYIKMSELPYDAIHHIDMHMKLLNEETLLVAEYPQGVSDGPQIEENLQYVLDNFTTKYGTPFNVIRIPSPPSTSGAYPGSQPGNTTDGYYRTYTNSVFINETVLVPFYREEYDTIAQRIYEEALPGYNIVGIDCDDSGNNIIALSGAIHCITHTVGVNDPLLISYKQIDDVCLDDGMPYVSINAIVKHKSGINNVNFNYRSEGENQFTSTSMQDSNGDDLWEAVMTFDFNSNVEYYISATANSSKQQVRPITAPEGFYSFSYDYCEEQPLLSCTLSNGEIVESGWSGSDNGLNYCNTCSCEDGVLLCTYMLCDPCGAEPDPGMCLAAIPAYYFNQVSGSCEEFTWGGCGGTVPFETLQECENTCETNSYLDQNISSEKELIKIIDILGREVDPSSVFNKTLLYIYDDGSVQKTHFINQ